MGTRTYYVDFGKGGNVMKIDYISDLHLDCYVQPEGSQKKYDQQTREFLETLLPESKGEVLIVAGDISHFNHQSFTTLHFFSEHYAQVFAVMGNHDYYLVSKKQRRKYHEQSIERKQELMHLVEQLPNVKILICFERVIYKGVSFGGATSWYQAANVMDSESVDTVSNKASKIVGMDIVTMHHEEMIAYKELQDVDVLITHVPPIYIDSHQQYESSACYVNELRDVKANVCVFGHCHEQNVYEKGGKQFLINALGYPDEELQQGIRSFEYGG